MRGTWKWGTLGGMCAVAVALPAPASAQDAPARIADSLRADPVYADPRARPTLSPRQAGRVRLRILERNLGRIKIAVVRPRTASREGGVRGLADAIDRRLVTPGTLLVVAGDNAWVTVSYDRPQQAVAAVRRAFARRGSLADHLVAAVDGIARVDPGPQDDLTRSPGLPGVPQVDDAADDFLDTIALVFWVVGAMIALPFLIGALLLVRAVWRSVRRSREVVGDGRVDAREELVALGEQIRALDAQTTAFAADSGAQAHYERALNAYERADRLLGDADSPQRLDRVRAALADGHREVAAARTRLAARAGAAAGAQHAAEATPVATGDDALRDAANKAFGRE